HGAPRLVVVEPVEVVTRSHAGLAAGARIEVDLERVLLTRTGRLRRQQRSIAPRIVLRFVRAREALDGGELVLLAQVLIEKREPDRVRQLASAFPSLEIATRMSSPSTRSGYVTSAAASFDRHEPERRSNVRLCSGHATFGVPHSSPMMPREST